MAFCWFYGGWWWWCFFNWEATILEPIWIRTKGCTGATCLSGNPYGARGVTLFGKEFLSRAGAPSQHPQRRYEALRVTKKERKSQPLTLLLRPISVPEKQGFSALQTCCRCSVLHPPMPRCHLHIRHSSPQWLYHEVGYIVRSEALSSPTQRRRRQWWRLGSAWCRSCGRAQRRWVAFCCTRFSPPFGNPASTRGPLVKWPS